jgi:hypothetical protein
MRGVELFFPSELNGAPIFLRLEDIDGHKLFSLRGFRAAKRVLANLKSGRQQEEMRDLEWN